MKQWVDLRSNSGHDIWEIQRWVGWWSFSGTDIDGMVGVEFSGRIMVLSFLLFKYQFFFFEQHILN